jgi:hypothetical protein
MGPSRERLQAASYYVKEANGFDLFSNPHGAEMTQTPQWQTLPVETRRTLTRLMVRLILDHADGERAPERGETRRRRAGGVGGSGFHPRHLCLRRAV